MEARLIDVILQIFRGDSDPFLIEDAFIAANKAEHFSVFPHESQNDVVPSWTLPPVERYPDSDLLGWFV